MAQTSVDASVFSPIRLLFGFARELERAEQREESGERKQKEERSEKREVETEKRNASGSDFGDFQKLAVFGDFRKSVF